MPSIHTSRRGQQATQQRDDRGILLTWMAHVICFTWRLATQVGALRKRPPPWIRRTPAVAISPKNTSTVTANANAFAPLPSRQTRSAKLMRAR